MSARNYLSAREKSYGKSKLIDCLPNIKAQKFGYRSGQELPPLSANTSKFLNRNINYYDYEIDPYLASSGDRAGTPFSDLFSESETGTPDFHSEESDSSAGSALRQSTAEASKTLAQEWERIERTLYNEDGEKSSRLAVIEECKQWRQLHPQLRVVGKAIPLPEKRLCYRQIELDEVIAMHYSDYEQFSESEERLSQSSNDVTPQNSPRPSINYFQDQALEQEPKYEYQEPKYEYQEPKLAREKVFFYTTYDEEPDLSDSFCSLLQITPIQIRSPMHKKKPNPCILRSEIASSRWMKNSRPDSSLNCDRNSAKSFVSLDTKNFNMALSASERNNIINGNRVVTARQRELGRLEPLLTPESQNDFSKALNTQQYNIRKVSLPPLLLDEEKRKVASAKKHNKRKSSTKSNQSTIKSFYQLDRFRH